MDEFQYEKDRLDFTKAYMERMIAAQKSGRASLKQRQDDTLENLDFQDSSLRYQEMLSHANFMKMSRDQLDNLKSLRRKPYFARIDFHRKENPEKEQFYIGKVSLFDRETQLPIILDWRSPLANVYYEGRLGEVSYEALGVRYEGEVSLKRQYQIEEGELMDYRDIDVTAKDDLLQESLSQNADGRLSEIVSTIQEEQNRVIRADLRKPIIVQGAAGSGKTTIALHRISYFLYTMKEIFKPDDMLILAPNRLFIQYISEVLPELGVQRAAQSTFMDFAVNTAGIQSPVITQHEVLTQAVEGTMDRDGVTAARLKGSRMFQTIMDTYIQSLKKQYKVEQDFTVLEFRIKKARAINRLFFEEYSYFPYEVRVRKIKAVLQSELRRKKKQILEKVAAKYDEALDKALYGMKDPDKRKIRVSYLITRKEERLTEIKKAARTAVASFMKQYPAFHVEKTYKKLFEESVFLSVHPDDTEDWKAVRRYSHSTFAKGKVHSEDLAGLLYLFTFLKGIDAEERPKKVVIDEAQDYSYFEIYALRRACQTNLFTIVGDLAQGIYQYRGIDTWGTLVEDIFPKASYLTLQKTYRTTIEIMDLANGLLTHLPVSLPRAEPVARHGPLPQFLPITPGWEEKVDQFCRGFVEEGMSSFAMITKTMAEAEDVQKRLETYGMTFTLLKEGEGSLSERMVLPAYLAKGLEFDVVLLYNDRHPFQESDLDLKMLYVAMTRPLHRLMMIGADKEDFLLHLVQPDRFQEV
ncbi:RNA polymerase recycling motor HelD [Halobacillus litoralis]|uniref:RNA polymerase recycling motor HelD n=1 Tax=Halobacillus litoralis TaxID=45668 RepID=UPI00136C66B6|nr:RNA polymerase recycling motor HelD [Halobacillus litoralis]MYL38701.1 AAA family ATPase [Halobacillus litoralis]